MNSKLKRVRINIKSKQKEKKEDYKNLNKINSTIEGKYFKKNAKYYLIYEEKDLEGMENTNVNLRIEQEKIIMKRNGNISTRMEFISNQETQMRYICPQGIMNLKIFTKKISIDKNANEEIKNIVLEYLLKFDDEYETFNKINIQIEH